MVKFLIFNQNLPHGNIVNNEKEKQDFLLIVDLKVFLLLMVIKKLENFFDPITLKPASKLGMIYKYPKI